MHVASEARPRRSARRAPSPRASAAVTVAVAAGLGVWIALGHAGSSPSSGHAGAARAIVGRPYVANVAGLSALERSLRHAVFWVGAEAGTRYEVTMTKAGSVYVRYLSAGASVGDSRPIFTTVGTYPVSNAYAVVRKSARTKGSVVAHLTGAGLAVRDASSPTSVYVAYPGSQYLVEVYVPSPGDPMALVRNGALRTVP